MIIQIKCNVQLDNISIIELYNKNINTIKYLFLVPILLCIFIISTIKHPYSNTTDNDGHLQI